MLTPFIDLTDTHAHKHVYIIQTGSTSELIAANACLSITAGINRPLTWLERRTEANAGTLWVIEGATSAGIATAHSCPVLKRRGWMPNNAVG